MPTSAGTIEVTSEASPVARRVGALLTATHGQLVTTYRPGQASAASVLVVGGETRLQPGFTSAMGRLRLVVRTGAGYDNVPTAELVARGVPLVAPRLTGDDSVAEFVIGAAITLLRRIPEAQAAARRGDFHYRDRAAARGLSGLTMGVVGYGRIGRRVAALARALHMNVLVHRRRPQITLERGMQECRRLTDLLARADVVSLCCSLTDDTRHLIGAAELAAMKEDSVLVNTARGGVVDEVALRDRLVACPEASAAVDVHEGEPDPLGSSLGDLPNVLLTPHVAGLTAQSIECLADFVTRTVVEFLAEGTLPREHLVVDTARARAKPD